MATLSFGTLQRDVGEWSEANFGDQPTVNPLLGVGEELGELREHVEGRDGPTERELDCVGDALVYLADFCYRRGLDSPTSYDCENPDDADYDDPLDGVSVALGRLNRSVLKRRQGIRLDESRVGDGAERRAVAMFLAHLSEFARVRGYAIEECVRVAWDDEVSDREWDSSYTDD